MCGLGKVMCIGTFQLRINALHFLSACSSLFNSVIKKRFGLQPSKWLYYSSTGTLDDGRHSSVITVCIVFTLFIIRSKIYFLYFGEASIINFYKGH